METEKWDDVAMEAYETRIKGIWNRDVQNFIKRKTNLDLFVWIKRRTPVEATVISNVQRAMKP